jgi:Tfp pilus assembly protein PilX
MNRLALHEFGGAQPAATVSIFSRTSWRRQPCASRRSPAGRDMRISKTPCIFHAADGSIRRVPQRWQRGVALITSLFVLLAVTMIALAVSRVAFDGERSARAERDRQLAFQAAEAGLVDGERDIEGGADPASVRAAMFHDDGIVGFVPGCGREPFNLGLCAAVAGATPAWQMVNAAATTPYGSYTGAALPHGAPLPLAPPRYIIELLPAASAGEDAGAGRQHLFRITAFGYGARPGTLVVLQSVYRADGGKGAP